MDVVASTAFSVDIDSINHPSDPFVANIKKMVKFNFLNPLLVLIGILYPILWNHIVCPSILSTELIVCFLLSFMPVLFPFLSPLFEKMNMSFFPADVLDFFYNFLRSIKSDRSNQQQKVMFLLIMFVVGQFLHTFSPHRKWRETNRISAFIFLQNRVDFMQLMVNAEVSDSDNKDGSSSKGKERTWKGVCVLLCVLRSLSCCGKKH